MNTNRRSLEQLIPAVYRTRDAERNGPLSELLQVLSEQVRIVDSNIEQLYNDLFVETCQPWVVPYHGELVGLQPTATPPSSRARLSQTLLNPRREVADAIHFEGRKGTLAVLEEIAAATANWPARAVEYYAQVSTFQSSHHPDPAMAGTVRVTGNTDELNQIGTPFNSAPHLIDARVTAQGSVRTFDNRGLFHPSHIGLQIWRLGLYQLSLAETRCVCARSVATDDGEKELRVHTFDSFGLESQLAIKPAPESDETLIAGERNVPGALSLRAFSEGNDGASSDYYGRDKSVGIWVQVGANGIEFVRTEQIVAMDLAWLLETCCGGADEDGPSSCTQRRTDLVERLSPRNAEADQDELETQNLAFAVDPEHGLIAFAGKQEVLEKLTIKPTFHHNFSAAVGGGQYDRSSRTNAYRTNTVVQRVRDRVRTGTPAEQTLANQIECLDDDGIVSTEHAVVELASNEIFDLGIEEVTILNGCHLEIRSAKNRRPTVDLCNKTACDPALIVHLGKHARLTIEGIRLFGGKIVVRDYDSGDTVLNPSDDCEQPNATQTTRFSVSHSSLLPNPIREANGCKGSQSVSIDFQVPNGQLVVDHSIVGPIHVNGDPKNLPSLVSIKDSVVDGRASDNHAIVGVHAAILRVAAINRRRAYSCAGNGACIGFHFHLASRSRASTSWRHAVLLCASKFTSGRET